MTIQDNAMPITDYLPTKRVNLPDRFEPEVKDLSFPCCACIYADADGEWCKKNCAHYHN